MKKRLPAAFVMTFSSLAGGCHDAAAPPEDVHWNPPPQDVTIPDAASDAASATPATTSAVSDDDAGAAMPVYWNPPPPTSPSGPPTKPVHFNPPPQRSYNPVDAKTGLVITKTDHGCQIDPGAGARPGDPRKLPPKAIKCPPVMNDPAWDNCKNGQIYSNMGATDCQCVNHGNPPMIRTVTCPAIPDGGS